MAVIREAYSHHYGYKVEQYLVETCKMLDSFTRSFRVKYIRITAIEFSVQFL